VCLQLSSQIAFVIIISCTFHWNVPLCILLGLLLFICQQLLSILIQFQPYPYEKRKINVKFSSCRIRLQSQQQQQSSSSPTKTTLLVDWDIPLGLVGPTGWLNATYIDDQIRIITRAVCSVLARPTTVLQK
jgi:hypothetical protein